VLFCLSLGSTVLCLSVCVSGSSLCSVVRAQATACRNIVDPRAEYKNPRAKSVCLLSASVLNCLSVGHKNPSVRSVKNLRAVYKNLVVRSTVCPSVNIKNPS
jgi:hypothetical protein